MKMLNLSKTLPCVVALVTSVSALAPAFAGTYQLNAIKTDSFGGGRSTTLGRGSDLPPTDLFNQAPPQADQPIDPGNNLFALQTVQTGGAPPAFNLNADQDAQPSGDLQPQQAMPAQQEVPGLQRTPQRFTPQDIDSTPDMQIAWDAWHRRVAAAVFSRFQMMANTAFVRSRPLTAVASYTVTRNGQIMNIRLVEKDQNPVYNAIVLTAIQQLNGDFQTLQFPEGTHRMTMDKVGTFIHNNGGDPNIGFKTITGDRETIRGRR